MKLVSLNVERHNHTDRVFLFLQTERPDVLCLQEVPEYFVGRLESQGYYTTFSPTQLFPHPDGDFQSGILIASRHYLEPFVEFYHKPTTELPVEDKADRHATTWRAVVGGTVHFENTTYTVASTHYTWTSDGSTLGVAQQHDFPLLMSVLRELPAHVLCGDLNIARGYNPLYELLCEQYTDVVPKAYTSSLDRDLHRHGADADLQILFESYMVDYVMTQNAYIARNVRLEFGISDHAAVIADIERIKA